MGPHAASLGLTTSYFKATILPAFLFFFIFGDAEKEALKTRLEEKPIGQNKKYTLLLLYFFSAFSCLICAIVDNL